MDAATTYHSPVFEEKLRLKLPNKIDDYDNGSINSGRHQGYGSWLVSAATGGRRHIALSHVTTSPSAGWFSRGWCPPFMRLDAERPLSGKGTRSSIVGHDGRTSNHNRLLPTTAADAMEVASGEEGGGGEEEEEEVVVGTSVGSGVGMWASRGMLATAAMLFGTSFGCVKLLDEAIPMSLVTALRFTVAVVPFLPFLIKTNLGVFRAGVEIGVFDAVGFWAQSKSLTTTSASKVAFICSLAVILVPVIDAVVGARDGGGSKADKATEAADKKFQAVVFATLNGPWFPALLAVAGVACLELIGVTSGPGTGDAWAMVQPLCFGAVFWLTERGSKKYPGDMFGIVAAHLLTVAVFAIGWCAQAEQLPVSFESLSETVLPSSGSLAIPLALLWVGLMSTSLTVLAETLAMEKVSAAESVVIFSTEPIWGTAFAAILLGESIGWNTGLGAMLIILACTWSSVGPAIQSNLL